MMMAKMKGKMVIGQSGGPTAVINASLAGALREAQRHPEIDGVYGALHGIQGVIDEQMIDLGREPREVIERMQGTPAAILGSCRYKVAADEYERILGVLRAHDIRFFFYIGGNDYGSAARFTALSVRDAGRDTEAIGIVDNVKIVEIMGRNAGWLTAAAALAREEADDAPHLIYVPERSLRLDALLQDVQRIYQRLGYVVVAAAETLRDEDGHILTRTISSDVDSFGHPQRGGVADFLCQVIKERLGLKARFDKAGTIQRSFMAAASPVDVGEAVLVGEAAVRHAVAGITNRMVTLERVSDDPYECTTGLVDLARVANAERHLPNEYLASSGNDVTQAFIGYARPLIGGPLPPYARLTRHQLPPRSE
jgi:6-phosphofructokinase